MTVFYHQSTIIKIETSYRKHIINNKMSFNQLMYVKERFEEIFAFLQQKLFIRPILFDDKGAIKSYFSYISLS